MRGNNRRISPLRREILWGEGDSYDPAAATLFAAAGSMSLHWETAYDNLFARIREQIGISKMKALWIYKAPNETTGKLNIFNPGSNTASPVASPVWDYQGYKLNGTSQYLNSNYKPVASGSFSKTNCAFFGWSVTSSAANQCLIGARAGTAGTSLGIFLNPRTAGNIYNFNCNTDLSTGGANTDASGLYVVYRTDNTNFKVNKNGVDVATAADAANDFLDLNLFLGASNNNGTAGNYSPNQLMLNGVCDGDVPLDVLYEILEQFNAEANEAIANDLMTAYVAALAAQGGSLSATEYSAKRDLYKFILDNNYYSDIIDFGVMLGGNLNASLVKSKYPSGVAGSLANTNFVSGDYSATLGINTATNTNKLLQTGIIPTAHGLSKDNITVMVYRSTEPVVTNNSFMMGLNNASGETELKLGYDVGMISNTGRSPICVGMLGLTSTGTVSAYFDRTLVIDAFTAPTAAYDTEITLFKAKRSGTDRFTPGGIILHLVAKGMTTGRYMALNQRFYDFFEEIGRRTAGSDFVICGDSVTLGSDATTAALRYSRLLAEDAGLREANFGLSGTRLRDRSTTARDFMERLPELANYRIGTNYPLGKVHMQYLINDMTLDSEDNGTQATADSCRDAYNTAIDYIHGTLGVPLANISIGTFGYTTTHNNTKRSMYVAAARASAVAKGVKFADSNQAFIDTGTPEDLLSDPLHPNDDGHQLHYITNKAANFVS